MDVGIPSMGAPQADPTMNIGGGAVQNVNVSGFASGAGGMSFGNVNVSGGGFGVNAGVNGVGFNPMLGIQIKQEQPYF